MFDDVEASSMTVDMYRSRFFQLKLLLQPLHWVHVEVFVHVSEYVDLIRGPFRFRGRTELG